MYRLPCVRAAPDIFTTWHFKQILTPNELRRPPVSRSDESDGRRRPQKAANLEKQGKVLI